MIQQVLSIFNFGVSIKLSWIETFYCTRAESAVINNGHSRPQRPRSFWSAPRIATSGPVQRHSGFEWLCKHNRLRPEPIRFVRLDSELAQSGGKSVNRGLLGSSSCREE